MKVTNSTRYSGVMLRSIFLSVVSDVERVFSKDLPVGTKRRAEFIREHCHVEYVYTRRGGCSGRASLGGGWCRIRIARNEVSLAQLIWLIRHEVYHLFGVHHAAMPNAVNRWSDRGTAAAGEMHAHLLARYGEVVKEEPLPTKRPVSVEERRVTKLTSIEARIVKWESKRKRAETALKKLQKQRRYYEGQLAQAAKEKP